MLQLWPENPTYQVYVPGYATNQPGHHVSMTHGVVPNVYGSQLSIRARSGLATNLIFSVSFFVKKSLICLEG